jgi:hypothetical protein
MSKAWSNDEAVLADFFEENGIEALWAKNDKESVPKIRNPNTGWTSRPDFWLPKFQMYVEVKGKNGKLTFDFARSLTEIIVARGRPRYFLFQAGDHDWVPKIDHWTWPEVNTVKDQIEERAQNAREAYEIEHRPRRGSRYSSGKMAYIIEFQRQELLVLANSESAAAEVSDLTSRRLRAFLRSAVDGFWDRGWLPPFVPVEGAILGQLELCGGRDRPVLASRLVANLLSAGFEASEIVAGLDSLQRTERLVNEGNGWRIPPPPKTNRSRRGTKGL